MPGNAHLESSRVSLHARAPRLLTHFTAANRPPGYVGSEMGCGLASYSGHSHDISGRSVIDNPYIYKRILADSPFTPIPHTHIATARVPSQHNNNNNSTLHTPPTLQSTTMDTPTKEIHEAKNVYDTSITVQPLDNAAETSSLGHMPREKWSPKRFLTSLKSKDAWFGDYVGILPASQ